MYQGAVLVVDDDIEYGQFIISVLQDMGIRDVSLYFSAEVALKNIKAGHVRPSTCLIDVVMHPVNGMELVKRLISDHQIPAESIWLMSEEEPFDEPENFLEKHSDSRVLERRLRDLFEKLSR